MKYAGGDGTICGSVNCSKNEEIEVVWSRDKVKRTIQDSPTSDRARVKDVEGDNRNSGWTT